MSPPYEAYAPAVELFRAESDWRKSFGRACRASAARLRGIAPQVRDELAERGRRFKLEEVEDVLLTLAREKLPESPAACWDADYTSEICRAAMHRLQTRYRDLSGGEREQLDLSGQNPHEARMLAAAEENNPAAFRAALKTWERVGLEALEGARKQRGAA